MLIDRPYKEASGQQLERKFKENGHNLTVCREILHELSFRGKAITNKAAAQLRVALCAHIEMLERQAQSFFTQLAEQKGLLTKEETAEIFPFLTEWLLNGFLISATGSGFLTEQEVRSLSYWQGAILADADIWRDEQVIVIGREQFDEAYLKQAIELIVRRKIHIYFVSQELFLECADDGVLGFHYPGDLRIEDHPGLLFLASLGFKWPVLGAYQGTHKLEQFEAEDHDLATRYGYSVRAGVSIATRRRSLLAGVEGLGLETVAYHIAGLIQRNNANPVMKGAVPRWRDDLGWLYQNKYANSPHSFVWPLMG
jgi:hypothetical protein